MQTIGIVGGMSWYSTAQYYRVINEQVQARLGGHASARIALQSVDFAEIRQCQVDGDWDGAGRIIADAARACEAGGADVVLIATNLMHRVADQVQAAVDVPLLHIADALAQRARDHGWTRVGVLGTRWVMEEDWYVGRLARGGLDVVVPPVADRVEVDRVVFDELTRGRVTEAARATYRRVIGDLVAAGAEAIVLGCTEIELLVRAEDSPVPLLDSMRTHAEAAVTLALDSALRPQGVEVRRDLGVRPAAGLPETGGHHGDVRRGGGRPLDRGRAVR